MQCSAVQCGARLHRSQRGLRRDVQVRYDVSVWVVEVVAPGPRANTLHSIVKYSIVKYSIVKYSMVKYSIVKYSLVKYSEV